MTKKTITHFMWSYQEHFCILLRFLAERTFDLFAHDTHPEAILVGAQKLGATALAEEFGRRNCPGWKRWNHESPWG
jgi:hypothetical protein